MPEFRPAPGSLPPGHRVYAVGDIHGCADRLASLHAMVAADLAARPVPRPLLLHIGDCCPVFELASYNDLSQ